MDTAWKICAGSMILISSIRFDILFASRLNVSHLLTPDNFGLGFASLNSLDPGFFGRGIYLTSNAEYALRYAGTKPAIVIAWILPGHPYPVVEDHKSDESLLGAPLQPGCQSHYVRTDMNGYVVKKPDPTSYDEIVLGQENLVCPVLVLEIDVSNVLRLKIKLDEAMKKLQETTSFTPSIADKVRHGESLIELEEKDKDDSYVDWDG